MPVPVGRRNVVAAILVGILVILAGSWFGFGGRRGLTPVAPAATGAEEISDLYSFIGLFAVVIFLSVTIPLALIIARYRERGLPREVEGPQITGQTRLEILWTAIPFVIVLLICAVVLYVAPRIADPATAAEDGDLTVEVVGSQFYWRYVYENGAVALDTLVLPVDRVAELHVTSPETDVIHSFWAPALGGKIDAIPGVENELNLRPNRTGRFRGVCAELCGIQHSAMELWVEVLPQDEFDRWLERTGREQRAGRSDLGQIQFERVCSKCHFAAPEYAPNIATNPQLGDAEAIRQLVTEGRGRMPAVGREWSEQELDALTGYLETIAPPEESDGS
jgi:cytochrome c oxidase subunit II